MTLPIRLSSQQRRGAILAASIRLFAERGFRGVTTRELAAAVGVSEPVLYQHFPSKKELYRAIIEASKDEGYTTALESLAQMAAGENDDQFFNHLAHAMILWHETKPDLIRLKLFAALEGHELTEELQDKQVQPFIDIITGYIGRRMEQGVFLDVNPLGAAIAFCGMVSQYCQSSILFRSAISAGIVREEMVTLTVQIFLNGIRQQKS